MTKDVSGRPGTMPVMLQIRCWRPNVRQVLYSSGVQQPRHTRACVANHDLPPEQGKDRLRS